MISLILNSAFKPVWWLTHAHAQTLYPALMRRLVSPVDRTERFELEDGDFIDLAWMEQGLPSDAPLVVVLHGVGGNVHSTYVSGQLQAYRRAGWRAVLMHFRGASETPNRLPRFYHAGDTGDLDVLLRALAIREPHTRKAVVGFSLGGNVLLKWLGEQGQQALIHAAVAVSVPFELDVAATRINQGFSRLYQASLLRSLSQVLTRKMAHDPAFCYRLDRDVLRSFWTFDEHITAPLHGFPHARAYYQASSSRPYLASIATKTLIVHALDDPFMKPEALPRTHELSPSITFELSANGGHLGFVSGDARGMPCYWLDQRIFQFLSGFLGPADGSC